MGSGLAGLQKKEVPAGESSAFSRNCLTPGQDGPSRARKAQGSAHQTQKPENVVIISWVLQSYYLCGHGGWRLKSCCHSRMHKSLQKYLPTILASTQYPEVKGCQMSEEAIHSVSPNHIIEGTRASGLSY